MKGKEKIKNNSSNPSKNGNSGISKRKIINQDYLSESNGTGAIPINGKIKAELLQSDREAFLNAFEKPTQIYRYIRSRTIHSPIFLHRNLSYMKQRMSRNHGKRPNFHVEQILPKLEMQLKAEQLNLGKDSSSKNFYNIALLGFFDPDNNWDSETKAKVEIQVARICFKRRKEVRAPTSKAFEGISEVKVQTVTNCTNLSSPIKNNTTNNYNNNIIHLHNSNNNNCSELKKLCPVLSVPSECFNIANGHIVRSYILMVRITIPKSYLVKIKTENGSPNQNSLHSSYSQPSNTSNISSQPQVSKKTASFTARTNILNHGKWTSGLNLKDEDINPRVVIKQEDQAHAKNIHSALGNNREGNVDCGNCDEPKPKRRRSAPVREDQFIYTNLVGGTAQRGESTSDDVVFMGQITIYDNQSMTSVGSADYEIIVRQCQRKRANFSLNKLLTQEASWEILDANHPKVQIPQGGSGKAKLNISIRTSSVKAGPYIERPSPILSSSSNGCGGMKDDKKGEDESRLNSPQRQFKVIYQFLYNNNSRQQTEAREDLRCPWCSLNCLALYSLLKHLKLCHPRFHFAYVPVPSGARIDVSINESFDGSYSGSAYDLIAQPPGEAFARNGPTRRTNIFSILVCHPIKVAPSLQEFIESEEKDVDHRKTFITGHNRLYHHTTTCLPIMPKEIDVDSEGEPDPEWLQIKTSMMIDEFTDVNEGEKELMKMWNLHVLKHNYVGDCQIPLACNKFVEYKGKDILKKNLYRNFVLHLTNLFDFGLLNPMQMHETILKLQQLMKNENVSIHNMILL